MPDWLVPRSTLYYTAKDFDLHICVFFFVCFLFWFASSSAKRHTRTRFDVVTYLCVTFLFFAIPTYVARKEQKYRFPDHFLLRFNIEQMDSTDRGSVKMKKNYTPCVCTRCKVCACVLCVCAGGSGCEHIRYPTVRLHCEHASGPRTGCLFTLRS